MAVKDKRYYWLKLKRDFFKRHDIQIIESMENGKDYILFYLKLLCESVDHDGNLRFSEQIPYNEKMLATITNTNVDIVRSAINIFTELHMMEIMDDGTYFMSEVNKMLGSETYWAQQKREKKERESLSVGNFPTESNLFPTSPSKSKRKSIELDIDKDIDVNISDSSESEPAPKPKKEKPVKHKYGEYKNVLLTDDELSKLKTEYFDYEERIENLSSYIASTGKSYKSHYATIRNWARKDKDQKQTGRKEIVPDWMKKKSFNNFEGRNYSQGTMDDLTRALIQADEPKELSEEYKQRVQKLKEGIGAK